MFITVGYALLLLLLLLLLEGESEGEFEGESEGESEGEFEGEFEGQTCPSSNAVRKVIVAHAIGTKLTSP